MKPLLARILISVFLTVLSAFADALSTSESHLTDFVYGEAFDMVSGEKIYSEYHCRIDSNQYQDVHYVDSTGFPIAYKRLNYQTGLTTPSFVQKNILTNDEISAGLSGRKIDLRYSFPEDKSKVIFLSVKERDNSPLVIDSGFDAFIQRNWDQLLLGTDVHFLFPLVSRLRLIELRVKPSRCSYDTRSDACFSLEASNWLIRILADPIELGYNQEIKRLSRYRGLSNIEDKNRESNIVEIKYHYQNTPFEICLKDGPLLRGARNNEIDD